ncbi:twin-arginine translocation signal domain-containing protein [Tateyamaria sp.]
MTLVTLLSRRLFLGMSAVSVGALAASNIVRAQSRVLRIGNISA